METEYKGLIIIIDESVDQYTPGFEYSIIEANEIIESGISYSEAEAEADAIKYINEQGK